MMKQSVSHSRMPGGVIHHIHHRSISRPVNRDVFTEESPNAPTWVQVPASNNSDQSDPVAVRLKKTTARSVSACQ
jgi:hypothetical protein